MHDKLEQDFYEIHDNSDDVESLPKKILVVDDDPTIRRLLYKFLSRDYDVKFAEDGKTCIAIFEEFNPDLVIMDINLPDATGYILTRELQARTGVFVVMLTSRSDEADKIRGFLQGADDYITKPFSLGELELRVATVLKRGASKPQEEQLIKLQEKERTVERLEKIIGVLTKENENLRAIIKDYDKTTTQDSIDLSESYRFITGAVAHNLRGELLHIGTSINELIDITENSNFEAEVREECEFISRSLEYSQILLKKLLSHLNLGRPVLEEINILEFLERIESLVAPRLPSRINFSISIDSNKTVLSSSDQLTIVLLELIKNSTHALHAKGGSIKVDVQDIDGTTEISVIDNGHGIPNEIKDKLFDSEVKSKQGLGIGLFLCRRIILQLGADLTIQSSKDGTKASIRIPKSRTVVD